LMIRGYSHFGYHTATPANPWQPSAAATTAPSQYSSFSRGTTLPPTRPYLGSNSTTLDMSSYATGYHQTVPAGFSTTTSDTNAIKDQESKLETTYNPTQASFNYHNLAAQAHHGSSNNNGLFNECSMTAAAAANYYYNTASNWNTPASDYKII